MFKSIINNIMTCRTDYRLVIQTVFGLARLDINGGLGRIPVEKRVLTLARGTDRSIMIKWFILLFFIIIWSFLQIPCL